MNLKARVQKAEDKLGKPGAEPITALVVSIVSPEDREPYEPSFAILLNGGGRVEREENETVEGFEARVDALTAQRPE